MKKNENSVDCVAAAELNKVGFNCQYYFRNRPVVITDGAAQWEAIRKWSPDYLKSIFGDRKVAVKYNEQGIFDYNKSATTGRVGILETSFNDAVDRILMDTERVHYLQQESVKRLFPELLSEIAAPYLLDKTKRELKTNIWFGAKGCKSPLHFDPAENFLVQVLGRKRVTLFSPQESENLYPAVGENLPHCSRINVFAPDESAYPMYPLYQKASPRKMQFDLEPGNILYLPKGWWHAVESLDVSISINIWWAGIADMYVKWVLPRLFSRQGRAEIRAASAAMH